MTQPPNDSPNGDWPLDDDEGYVSSTDAERMSDENPIHSSAELQSSAFELPSYDVPAYEAPALPTAYLAEAEQGDGETDIVLPPMLAELATVGPETEATEVAQPEHSPEVLEPFTVPEDMEAFFAHWETTLVRVPTIAILDQVSYDLNVNIQDLLGVRL